ncbi:MAG: hypothetical protein CMJ78_27365 [Planctomycetaceae bacterium]|nr:hypothetical protein [Planctomycetaceae bacterium]
MPENAAGNEPTPWRYVFHGRVQGVSFRFTTNSIGRRFPVRGYVKNQPNGTVEMICIADEQTRKAFLEAISDAFPNNITDVDIEQLSSCPEYENFTVVY